MPARVKLLLILGSAFAEGAILGSQATLARDESGGNTSAATDADRKILGYQRYALTHTGDLHSGRKVFLDETTTKCAICHKVDGEGGEVGPDLSAIGGKFARPHLIESLLEPSRQIVEGYRTSILVTRDGRTHTGVIRQSSGDRVTLATENGNERVIPAAEIEVQSETAVSLMPEGLTEALSPDQFTDLVAYLESLRPGGKGSPGGGIAGPITLPEGFEVETVATGLTGCTALETTSDGRVVICEQTGSLRIVKDGRLLPQPVLTVEVDDYWERGLIGVTVHPDFPRTPFLYICYVAKHPYPHHRVSRFTVRGDVALPNSEKILLKGDDQRKLGGNVKAGHQGGALHFGPDGALFIAIGEQTAGAPSQRLDTFQGKILRIGPDGTIPRDNPFYDQANGKYRAIWAIGLRNPYTFAIQPSTGEMLINDVGDKYEEINRGAPGANYGWPLADGPVGNEQFKDPVHHYPHASICGGDFAPDEVTWPQEYRGKYYFAEFIHGWIKMLDPERPREPKTFARGLRNVVDLRFSQDGSLYVLLRNAWVRDDKFPAGTGSLLRIQCPKAAR